MAVILNSVFPVFALVVLGSILHRYGWVNELFFKTSDRLVYFFFFPVMLFWKTGGRSASAAIDVRFVLAVLAAVFLVYAAALLFVRIAGVADYQVGAFAQCCYRFNTYVGIAVIWNSIGQHGVVKFAVMIGFAIPFINLLAVSTLIWFASGSYSYREKGWLLLREIVTNPLILACLLGLGYSKLGLGFPTYVDNTFSLMSAATLPLALLSIGGSLSFDRLRKRFGMALAASSFKLVLLPAAGCLLMRALGVGDLAFKVGMIFFCLPTSTAAYVLSSQLQSDAELAAAAIVFSTLLSFGSLSLALVLLVG